MKKNFYIITAAALSLVACSRNQEVDIPDANLSLFARTESPADTKTVVESGVHVFWEPGDEIAVFMGEQSAKFTTDITAASGTATFKGTFGDATWPEDLDLWAVYPFSEDAVFDGETITTTLPSEQVAREGSFGKDMNLSIAYSNSSTLQFYNVGGGIRFSVTEEGIKKVMFEGLSGEIISGKVKIGMDENGKPEVREVTGGSQFITLLPPSGKETFEPGTWYYIVAIPGALEGGFKLRFYKDSDYARKESEKKVEIKRSIFGSLEKADEGIDFEPQTTHFPKTIEEIRVSGNMMTSVNQRIWGIISKAEKVTPSVKEDILNVDGVLDVILDESLKLLAVMQKDSVWINYFLDKEDQSYPIPLEQPSMTAYPPERKYSINRRTHTQSMNKSSSPLSVDGAYFNNKRNAIILAPEVFDYDLDGFKQYLIDAGVGYTEEDIVVRRGHEAVISDFYGETLCNYDIIIIVSHGRVGCNVRQQPYEPLTTIIDTRVKYSDAIVENFINRGIISFDKIAYCGGNDELTFAMTPDYLGDYNFEGACVFLLTCYSAERCEDEGSLVKRFLDNHAGLVTGNNKTIHSSVSSRANLKLLYLMSKGLSIQNAFDQIKESEFLNDFCTNWYEFVLWLDTKKNEQDTDTQEEFNFADFYVIKPDKSDGTKDYFFVNPYPILDKPEPKDGLVCFSWECRLRGFTDCWFYPDPNKYDEQYIYYSRPYPEESYSISYDIYIDGKPQGEPVCSENPDKTATFAVAPGGPHSWYVVANIIKGNTIIASYRTDGEDFTVTEEIHYETPEAKDLGLSVKWGSFNLGATKPEDYGIYYAWGETEPYYYSLDPLIWKNGKEAGYTWASYGFAKGAMNSLTKYCGNSEFGFNGFTDGKTELDLVDDAANVTLGEKWRIPTREEILELMNKCSWEWTTMDGVEGRKVTGPNGNSIFLPAAGDWDGTSHLNDANSNNPNGALGFYASSSLNTGNPNQSYFLSFGSGGKACYSNSRALGYTIRPVYGDPVIPVDGDGNLDDIPGHNI